MGKSASPRAYARRGVLDVLKIVQNRMSWMKSQWTVAGTLYDFKAPRDEHGNSVLRPRRTDEFPENQRLAWRDLAIQCDASIIELTTLRDYAIEQMDEAAKFEAERKQAARVEEGQ